MPESQLSYANGTPDLPLLGDTIGGMQRSEGPVLRTGWLALVIGMLVVFAVL